MDNSLKRGTVVLAVYPFTDLSSAKRRPALVVSATERPDRDCILAFITSRVEEASPRTWRSTWVMPISQPPG